MDDLMASEKAFKLKVYLASSLVKTIAGTLKTEKKEIPKGPGPVIYAFFHGRQFLLVDQFRKKNIAIMTSLSKDGDFQDALLRGLGYDTVRGSTSKGGARALAGMYRALLSGQSVAFAVDGAGKGPRGKVKPGAVYLSQKSGYPVIPLAASYASCHIFRKAWDLYRLPHPFSRALLLQDGPVYFKSCNSLEASCKELEERLYSLHKLGDEMVKEPNSLNWNKKTKKR